MGVVKSAALYEKSKTLIPGGTQTISKRPERFVPDKWPAYWDTAEGSVIRDLDGNEYIDYVMALGPIVLGYNHPAVNAAIKAQLSKGCITTLQSPLEVSVAEKLVQHIPSAEMVRFSKTGAEATSMAVRISRAYTNRDKIVSSGYSGWHDWWVGKGAAGSSRGFAPMEGVPKAVRNLSYDLPYGDEQEMAALLSEHGDETACLIVDTTEVNDGGAFLKLLRAACDRIGAVLIFDEIITGFRLSLGGAQQLYGVVPDMSTFGKAIANGMPLAATTGRRDLMQVSADLWITSTFGGEALSLAAAEATISELEKQGSIERLHSAGARLERGFKLLADEYHNLEVFGQPALPGIRFRNGGSECGEAARQYVAYMLEQGFLTRPNYSFFVSTALTDNEIARTLEATQRALEAVHAAA